LAEVFGQVLKLCDRAGLVSAGVIAIDGTRLAGNASKDRNREFGRIAREILAQAKATDEAEDQQHGEARGDELPEPLRTAEGRRAFFRQARQRLTTKASEGESGEREEVANDAETSGTATDTTAQGDSSPQDSEPRDGEQPGSAPRENKPRDGSAPDEATQGSEPLEDEEPEHGGAPGREPEYVFDTERIVARRQGRDAWPREARRQLEEHRCQHPEAVPRSRGERLVIAAERLDEDLAADRRGNEAYEHYKAHGRKSDGRRFGRAPNPWVAPELPEGKVNITDPDSHYMKTRDGFVQGYNAQAVVTEQQIVLAAEITTSTVDWSQLDPMVNAAIAELEQAGASTRPQIALADSQYWNEEHIDEVVANKHVQVLIPPESRLREEPRPGWTGGRYDWMRAVLKSEAGQQLYRQRPAIIEPVFGQTKHNRGVTRFLRRGRSAVRTEWRLLMATHNLAKLHRHHLATVRA
jgi:hypothetical protein